MTHKINIPTNDSQIDYQTINSLIEMSIESSKTLNWDITSTQKIKVFNNQIDRPPSRISLAGQRTRKLIVASARNLSSKLAPVYPHKGSQFDTFSSYRSAAPPHSRSSCTINDCAVRVCPILELNWRSCSSLASTYSRFPGVALTTNIFQGRKVG